MPKLLPPVFSMLLRIFHQVSMNVTVRYFATSLTIYAHPRFLFIVDFCNVIYNVNYESFLSGASEAFCFKASVWLDLDFVRSFVRPLRFYVTSGFSRTGWGGTSRPFFYFLNILNLRGSKGVPWIKIFFFEIKIEIYLDKLSFRSHFWIRWNFLKKIFFHELLAHLCKLAEISNLNNYRQTQYFFFKFLTIKKDHRIQVLLKNF